MTTAPATPLAADVCALVELLGRGTTGVLHVYTSSAVGFARTTQYLPIEPTSGMVPRSLLLALEDPRLCVHLRAAVRRAPAGDPHALGCLVASWAFTMVFEGNTPSRHDTSIAATARRVQAWTLPPSALIFGGHEIGGLGHSLTALWRLDGALDVSARDQDTRALARLQALAKALEATVPQKVSSLTIPVPGSLIREGRLDEYAEMLILEPSRVYTLEQFDAALQEKKTR